MDGGRAADGEGPVNGNGGRLPKKLRSVLDTAQQCDML